MNYYYRAALAAALTPVTTPLFATEKPDRPSVFAHVVACDHNSSSPAGQQVFLAPVARAAPAA